MQSSPKRSRERVRAVSPTQPSGASPTVGINSARSALQLGAGQVAELWLDRRRRDQRLAELAGLARKGGVHVRQLDRDALDTAAGGANQIGRAHV